MLFGYSTYFRHYGLMVLVLVSLSACADFASLFSHAEKPTAARPSQSYDATTFVESLSVARIMLENGGGLSSIADQKKSIEGYSQQKKIKSTNLILAIFEYDNGQGKPGRAMAPVEKKSGMDALSHVLTTLNATSYKLKDVRVVGVAIAPGVPVKITGKDLSTVTEVIEARHQLIISSAHKILPLQEAKQQLRLLTFFIGARQRDAAYICADNVKHLLAAVPQGTGDADMVASLVKDLEAAEGDLRRSMPY